MPSESTFVRVVVSWELLEYKNTKLRSVLSSRYSIKQLTTSVRHVASSVQSEVVGTRVSNDPLPVQPEAAQVPGTADILYRPRRGHQVRRPPPFPEVHCTLPRYGKLRLVLSASQTHPFLAQVGTCPSAAPCSPSSTAPDRTSEVSLTFQPSTG